MKINHDKTILHDSYRGLSSWVFPVVVYEKKDGQLWGMFKWVDPCEKDSGG